METPVDAAAVRQRIQTLERRNVRMCVILVLLVALFAAAGANVHSASATVRAGAVSIVDGNGHSRMLLGAVTQGEVIILKDGNGRNRESLVASSDSHALRLFDRSSHVVAALEDSSSLRGAYLQQGEGGVFFGLADTSPGLIITGARGSMKLSLVEGWAPSLMTLDAAGKERVGLGQTTSGDFTSQIFGSSADTADFSAP